MSLKYRILLIIVSVALLPIFIMSVATARISTSMLIEKEVTSKINILKDISEKVYAATLDRQLVGINFLLDPGVQTLLAPEARETLTPSEREKLNFEIQKLLQNYRYLAGTEALFLFSTEGSLYTNLPFSTWKLTDFSETSWFRESLDRERSYFWGDPLTRDATPTIPLVRVIRKLAYPEKVGYLISTIKESYLYNLYRNFAQPGTSEFSIVNDRGIVISHTVKEHIGAPLPSLYPDFSAATRSEGHAYVDLASRQFLLIYYTDSRNGWTYINSVPGTEIKRGARYIQLFTYALSGILIVVCFALAFFLSRSVIHPINSLAERMEKAQGGDWDVATETDKGGEIGKLERSFDVMIKELKKAFDEMVAIHEEKRRAELKVLEFQINPHFLYNTMSTIIWLSDNREHEAVMKVAESLSELFRISISKGREVITLAEELRHVQCYADIQQVRYPDEFRMEYAVEEEILSRPTIKLILQPLVENAIYHGIKPNEADHFSGLIRIEGRPVSGGDILFKVMDNGCMLSDEDIGRLNRFLRREHQKEEQGRFGVGIRNVHDRIQLTYGPDYGLTFSRGRDFTIVELLIPGIADPAGSAPGQPDLLPAREKACTES